MDKPKPPYLIKKQGWKGQTVWYYWKRPGPQIRIRGDYGSREFWENYEAAASKGVSRKLTEKKNGCRQQPLLGSSSDTEILPLGQSYHWLRDGSVRIYSAG